MCVILALACVMPVSAEEQGETKTTSLDVMLVVDDTVSPERGAGLEWQPMTTIF